MSRVNVWQDDLPQGVGRRHVTFIACGGGSVMIDDEDIPALIEQLRGLSHPDATQATLT